MYDGHTDQRKRAGGFLLYWFLFWTAVSLAIALNAQTLPVVVNQTVQCATTTDGTVVGIVNPLTNPVTAVVYSGTLPAANYYVKIAWYDAIGITLAGPEVRVQLVSTGKLQVSPPVAGMPATATGMKVYIGTSSGTETLQGSTTGSSTFNQSTPLVTGDALPSSNTTKCYIAANDAGWPTGTGYQVGLTSPSGTTLPGYPMMWQLLGPGNTINLSNGLPMYNGQVTYPIPILARPYNHASQSISGILSMSGYNLLNVNRIGIGTSVPGWGVDAETTQNNDLSGVINSQLGYLVDGGAGTTGQCLASDGTYFNTAQDCITALPTFYYQTVQADAVDQTQRAKLNFTSRFTLSDSSSPSRTSVDLATAGTAGTYAPPVSITTDAYGRVTSITSGTAVNRTCNSDGCYRIEPDGTIFAWGISSLVTGTPDLQSLTITFPNTGGNAFASTSSDFSLVVAGVSSATGDGNPHPLTCHVVRSTLTTSSGASAIIAWAQGLGGSGYTDLATGDYCSWTATGHL